MYVNSVRCSYDWVLVFEVHEDDTMEKTEFQQKYSMKNIIGALRSAGLHTHPFYSVQRDEVYCKVRCPLKRLMEQADQIDHNMQLDEGAWASCVCGVWCEVTSPLCDILLCAGYPLALVAWSSEFWCDVVATCGDV